MADFDSSLPIRTENAGDVIAKIADRTTPSNQLVVEADGSINTNVTGSVTVTATDLDIRDLSASQDNVAISDGTDTLAVNGDGSINAVVSATDLDIRDLSAAQDNVAISDGTDTLAVNGDGSINAVVSATDLDIRDLSASQDNVAISDGTDTLAVNGDGSINAVVSATDLDIRDLNAASDSVAAHLFDEAGVAFSATNPLPVAITSDNVGTEVNNYNTAAAVASSGTSNHDYTTLSAMRLTQIHASASGKMKIEVRVETAAASGVFNTIFVGFNSTANPNIDIALKSPALVASGAIVRIIRTNLDNQAQDLYSTISGQEA